MIYNETTTEVYIDKQKRLKPNRYNNHNTDKPDIYLDKPTQEIPRKYQENKRREKQKF